MINIYSIGFTGTRHGLTASQNTVLYNTLLALYDKHHVIELHHGDCVGADTTAHEIALLLHQPVVIHPPISEVHRAWCSGADRIEEPVQYLIRNALIVASCDLLIACPDSMHERMRSGTWQTVRCARKVKKNHWIIYPDGTLQDVEY